MANRELKQVILEKLLGRENVFIKKVSEIQYYTRCPFCGDSKKNIHTGHFYIRINPNDNFPIVYHCFKCPAEGVMDAEVINMLGIELNQDEKSQIDTMNKSSDKFSSYVNEIKELFFEYKLPDNYDIRKIRYLEERLGRTFTDKELKDIKVITSLRDFLLLNDIHSVTCKPNMARLVEKNYIGFLTNNNAHILFRDITEKEEIVWYKYPITKDSQGQRIMYSIKSDIDLYTQDEIIINLSEGVMDAVSIAYNLENTGCNILNVAVCGKFYTSIIKYLIGMGFIGDNITINIYSDKDYTIDTGIDYYRQTLKKFTYLVKEINVFYNMLSKDCGVPKEKISLKKERI